MGEHTCATVPQRKKDKESVDLTWLPEHVLVSKKQALLIMNIIKY